MSDSDLAVGGIAVDRLRSIIERIERLEEERKALSSDIKDIKAEAKSAGFDVKAINALLRERKMDADQAEELRALTDTYRDALDGVVMVVDVAWSKPAETVAPAQPRPSASAAMAAQEALADPRDAGSEAYAAGESISRNPHPVGDYARGEWDVGWTQGYVADRDRCAAAAAAATSHPAHA
jgi:uncharacterized protein (UPF0335 family)